MLDGGRGEQVVRVQLPAHGLSAHGEEQDAPEELADLLDPEIGVAALQRDDVRFDRGRHLRGAGPWRPRLPLQARRTLRAIRVDPLPQRAQAQVEILGHLRDGEAFLHTELDRLPSELHRVGVWVRRSSSLPSWLLLLP